MHHQERCKILLLVVLFFFPFLPSFFWGSGGGEWGAPVSIIAKQLPDENFLLWQYKIAGLTKFPLA